MSKHRKKKKTRRDTVEIARSVVEQAIGEKLSGEEQEQHDRAKNTPLIESKQKAGRLGGPARARSLTEEQRKLIAKKAADARWKKKN